MRYLHTMIRIGDIDRSVHFYTKVLGYQLLRRSDYEDGRFTNVFLGLPEDGDEGAQLELTYNWGVDRYDLGAGYGHIALLVDSMDEIAERLEENGLSFSWGPGKTPSGNMNMAFIKDPDGYQIELIEYVD